MAHIDCICPLTADGEPRHPDGDEVTLRERLDFRQSLVARNAIVLSQTDGSDTAEALAALTEAYLILGIEAWSVVWADPEQKGKIVPAPVTRQAITDILLVNIEQALVVADEADTLYRDAVLLPLVRMASKSSPPTPIAPSTSAPNGSPTKRPKRSRPSSITTSRTDGIVTISRSPDGDSSSSLSSA